MCGTHLQDHLLLVAQVERLQMAAATEVPNMDLMSILATEEQVRLHSIFDHVRCAPFATQHGIELPMPPKILVQKLRASFHLRLSQDTECFAFEYQYISRAFSNWYSRCSYLYYFRS